MLITGETVGEVRGHENSLPPIQFFCEPKTSLIKQNKNRQ